PPSTRSTRWGSGAPPPATTRARPEALARARPSGVSGAAHALEAGEGAQHDLVGPAADGPEPGVAEVARRPGLLHVPDAAVELEAGVDHLAGQASGLQLGHRREAGGVLARQVGLAAGVV